MGPAEMATCAALVDWVLDEVRPVGERDYALAEPVRAAVRAEVATLCDRYPLPETAAIRTVDVSVAG